MPTFHCPICNFKTFSEKDEKEHVKTHQKPAPVQQAVQPAIQSAEPTAKKIEEQKKPFIMPDFIKRFLHKTVSIALIDGSTISGELTGFNNYDLMLDDKILILKHAMMKMQEIEPNP
jgi:sRNA-binding regulator protein Hfq